MSISSAIPSALKRPLRALRALPDRVLHRSRRRRALLRLAAADVRTAVFICHGNINRSAYAAAVFARSVPHQRTDAVEIRSAGFIGPGRLASDLARSLASRRGLDLTGHRSRLIDAEELKSTDLIVVMDARQRRDVGRITGKPPTQILILGDLDPQPIERRTIQDPYGHSIEVFERVFDRIDRCAQQLATALWPG